MQLPEGKRIYFASDFHLGAPNFEKSRERETKIVAWLDQIKTDAHEIYLVGDIFDFWFEYKHAIPKGFIRFQGKIAELTDSGIPVHFFIGNHDMWMFDYFEKELNVKIHRKPIQITFNDKKFLIGHGDGLGPGDRGYKFIKKVFAAKWSQWCFARLHPNFGIWLAQFSSRSSRAKTGNSDEKYLGKENEWLYIYSKEYLETEQIDFFIFGHRHLPLRIRLNESSEYINIGEWLNYNTYAYFDGKEFITVGEFILD